MLCTTWFLKLGISNASFLIRHSSPQSFIYKSLLQIQSIVAAYLCEVQYQP
jgi:hypothetical protein